jgi:D-alanine-D-alanine ligase
VRQLKVAVLLGGNSPERDVSLVSGGEIIRALRKRGHEVFPVDPAFPEGKYYEPKSSGIDTKPPIEVPQVESAEAFNWLSQPWIQKVDLLFNALHGGAGEDGTIQALLETAGVVYTGAGVLGSAIAMNKDRSKALMREAGVQTARHILFNCFGAAENGEIEKRIELEMGFPVIVKPNCQGSSVGFSFVEKPYELEGALKGGSEFGDELMIEEYIPGRELTIAIVGGRVFSPVEIIPEGGFYNYKCKYTKGSSKYVVPARIEKETAEKLRIEALLTYNALSCRDYARVDFRVDPDGGTFCLELNTLPGMTRLSLVPMAVAEAGITFDSLVEKICFLALKRNGAMKEDLEFDK